MRSSSSLRDGMWLAAACYGIWGLFPAFWKLLSHVPPAEVLAHRVLWSAAFAGLLVAADRRRRASLAAILASRRAVAALAASGLAISVNWGTFLWLVANGRVLESSLGYFLNPLVVVFLSVVVLRERLRAAQWAAVALAALGVLAMAVGLGAFPWAGLAIAVSFALYGLVRKTVPLDPITGLFVETLLIAPLALLAIVLAGSPAPFSASLHALLAAGGVLTALPLVLFAAAAARLPFSTLGFFQYLAPTGHFLLAVLAYDEALTATHLVTFGCIWTALAVYGIDMFRHMLRQGDK